MKAAYAWRFNPDDPLSGLAIGERPKPTPPPGWVLVRIVAASVNHHDLWSLRGGEALRQRGGAGLTSTDLPRILGTDGAGISEDGKEVIVFPMIYADCAGPTGVIQASIACLSGRYDGTFAEYVCVPQGNLVQKPSALSFEEAACLPTAWLTAYRMLFEKANIPAGGTFLVQGASGALATALIMLGKSAGFCVWATGRSAKSRNYALQLGADAVFETGARLPDRVDAVMDSVGQATWAHSLKCLRRSGTLVVPGGTSGYSAQVDIAQIFTMDLRIVGTAMGSLQQLKDLIDLCVRARLSPPIDRVVSLEELGPTLGVMSRGELRGKAVVAL